MPDEIKMLDRSARVPALATFHLGQTLHRILDRNFHRSLRIFGRGVLNSKFARDFRRNADRRGQ
jgi:hypothetical protein